MLDDRKPDVVIWQTAAEDSVPEPAILGKRYGDVIELSQEGRYLNVNPETVPELVKALKQLQAPAKK